MSKNSIISRMLMVFVLCNISFDIYSAYPAKKNCSRSCFRPTVEMDTKQYYQKIELIKKDLLRKLGLTKPPNIGDNLVIPQVLINDIERTERLQKTQDSERTEKVIVMSEKGTQYFFEKYKWADLGQMM